MSNFIEESVEKEVLNIECNSTNKSSYKLKKYNKPTTFLQNITLKKTSICLYTNDLNKVTWEADI